MEKIILKETISKEKPKVIKKKTYKPRKKKEDKFDLVEEMIDRSGEIHSIKPSKQVGSYKIGKSFHIFFEKKPNSLHRFFAKLLLGWKWHDQK
jgi:hypothetical protein